MFLLRRCLFIFMVLDIRWVGFIRLSNIMRNRCIRGFLIISFIIIIDLFFIIVFMNSNLFELILLNILISLIPVTKLLRKGSFVIDWRGIGFNLFRLFYLFRCLYCYCWFISICTIIIIIIKLIVIIIAIYSLLVFLFIVVFIIVVKLFLLVVYFLY